MRIQTVDDLRYHLRLAMQVELSTIPPYLYAMYSIEDDEAEAARLLRSIVAEEMLHLALVSNILVAVGGQPDFLDPALVPQYPTVLAHHHPDLPLHLAPLSPELIRSTFLVIEQPDPPGSAPVGAGFDSLGEFYAVVADGIEDLARSGPLFVADQQHRQVANEHFYGAVEFNVDASGDLMFVGDLESARRAIDIIVHQGEGLTDDQWADPGRQELTHYAKLLRMLDAFPSIGPIRRLPTDPRSAGYPDRARSAANLFAAVYRSLFHVLDALYRPGGSQSALVGTLYLVMADIMGPLARHLTSIDIGDGTVAGPTFELIDLGPDPVGGLSTLATGIIDPAVADILAPLMKDGALAPLAEAEAAQTLSH
jgi:hypothetical protein